MSDNHIMSATEKYNICLIRQIYVKLQQEPVKLTLIRFNSLANVFLRHFCDLEYIYGNFMTRIDSRQQQ